jgi:predicted DNA-binding transcriptional regulator AlpA
MAMATYSNRADRAAPPHREAVHIPSGRQQLLSSSSSRSFADTSASEPRPHRFIRLAEVARLTSLSPTVIYDKMRVGAFPKQIQLFPDPRAKKSAVAWDLYEVCEWMEARLAARDAGRQPGPPLPGNPIGRPRKIIPEVEPEFET